MRADLHMHTFYSDGTHSPEEAVHIAASKGLSVISVCDHNTTAAYPYLRPACADAGITLVQGVELDVYLGAKRLHLLAYNFNEGDAAMAALIEKSRAELDYISIDMIERMSGDYPAVTPEDYARYVYPQGRGGWKGINYLLDKGLTDELMQGMEFHKRYGGYEPAFYALADACRIIKGAGGVPVLAHPGVWWLDDIPAFEAAQGALLEAGVGGVECFYPWHDEGFTRLCVDFCARNGLCATCGGDGHGEFGRYMEGTEYYIGIMDVDMSALNLKGIL